MEEKSCKDESCLEDFKEDYNKYKEKYNLPEFNKINQDFQIEKIAEIETDYFLREIRKFMSEKFASYLRFTESIINPSNAPMFVFSITKTLNSEDKIKLTEVYKELAKNQVELIERDLDYSEEKEAQFIKDSYTMWKKMEKDLLEVVQKIKSNWDNKAENNGKGYFG